jgi:hypothetical protein
MDLTRRLPEGSEEEKCARFDALARRDVASIGGGSKSAYEGERSRSP